MEVFRRIGIWAFFGFCMMVAAFAALLKLDDATTTYVKTVSDNRAITIKSRLFASSTALPAPYKAMDIFLSPIQTVDFAFTSVGGSWREIAPLGTHVEAQIRFEINGTWTEWIDLEEETDRLEEDEKYAIASTNSATAFQYKYILYGDGSKSPIVKNSEWTFIKTGREIPQPRYSSTTISGDTESVKTLALNTKTPEVITRSQWGADESYRYVKDNNAPIPLVERDPDFYNKYANELQYSRIVEADENGDKYKWPLQYPEKVEKIIIHHTATTGNLDNPEQAIRDIYYYHAITRGWGDIGYNYILDQQGNVYEGRFGGESVIGAHAGPGNHGSIGISFLGNYEASDVPEEAIVKASKFIYKKAKIHDITVQGSSDFRGKDRPNLFGHGDIMSTDCPGQFLFYKLPLIRILASTNLDLKPKFVKDYDFQDTSELYYLELKPQEQIEVTLKLENIGKNNWDNKTFIKFEDSADFENVISFPDRQGFDLAHLQESSVNSGATGTFKFKVKAGKKPKTVYLTLHPVINGKEKIEDEIVIPISVEQPVYKYELVSAKFPEKLMKKGDKFEGSVTLKNNGNISWQNSGENKITLKGNSLGITANLKETSVAAGGTGTFEFSFKANEKAGYYKEIFKPSMEGATWISSSEVSFETIIFERQYDSELLSKTALKEWRQGENYTITINLRNIGMETWNIADLKTTFAKNKDLTIKSPTMSPAKVAPGEIGTISFNVKIAEDADSDSSVLLATPKIAKNRISRTPFYFYYEIKEKQLQTSKENDSAGKNIRVKIGFSGDPQITANGSYQVYAGNSLLATLNAGEISSVTQESGQYRLKAGDANFLRSEPIRFVPDANAILKIKNYEHQPSWNQNLNDNEYRGALEVRSDDGDLIVINELALEDYLKGIGEVSNDAETEKIKALVVAARTYAEYYLTIGEKFPGEEYDLDDNPDVSQKYLGYGFEKRAPNIKAAVEETRGEVITYNGKVVKTPYFNQSDGKKTKSAKDVWGWTDTPYLVSVDDSYCDADEFSGHGVGMSGCGATGMAKLGKTYKEILQHYYKGVEIMTLY